MSRLRERDGKKRRRQLSGESTGGENWSKTRKHAGKIQCSSSKLTIPEPPTDPAPVEKPSKKQMIRPPSTGDVIHRTHSTKLTRQVPSATKDLDRTPPSELQTKSLSNTALCRGEWISESEESQRCSFLAQREKLVRDSGLVRSIFENFSDNDLLTATDHSKFKKYSTVELIN